MQETLDQQSADHEVVLRRVSAEKLQAFSLLETQRNQWTVEHKRVEELEALLGDETSRVAALEGAYAAARVELMRWPN